MDPDLAVFQFIHGFAGRSPVTDAATVFLAREVPYLLAIGWLALLLGEPRRVRRLYFFFAGALMLIVSRGLLTEIIRYVLPRPRPFEEFGFEPLFAGATGSSLPSGHAAFFFALAAAVWLINRKWGAVYAALATVNGAARVFAGVHWPLDIVAGALVAAFSAFLVLKLLGPYRRSLERRQEIMATTGSMPAELGTEAGVEGVTDT